MAVDLQESRKKINAIDAQIARLFEERMQVSTDVARKADLRSGSGTTGH